MTPDLDETHSPALRSWVQSANTPGTDFPIQNLPFGVFRPRGRVGFPRIGVAIGDQILDLVRGRDAGLFAQLPERVKDALAAPTLNDLMALGRTAASAVRRNLSAILARGREDFSLLAPMADADLLVPAAIGDYTDFYASIFHAMNVGRLFRPDNPLLPNYQHVPIAYHGRASSIVASGTTIMRPSGQTKTATATVPSFGPSERLDYEVEIGAFVGTGNALGTPIPIDHAEDHLFGLCLLNDWSARDIQAWEHQPLGPFLAKNFATSISPWVVTIDALAPFRSAASVRPPTEPQPLSYLASTRNADFGAFDVTVEAWLQTPRMRERHIEPYRLSKGSVRDLYWTVAQMVAHHTCNGCNLRPGDVIGSGTISGQAPAARGCLLEITRGGTEPLTLPTGETRTFLSNGDEVILRGYCERAGYARIGFGECRGLVA
jgi:fumarylacetoacetase